MATTELVTKKLLDTDKAKTTEPNNLKVNEEPQIITVAKPMSWYDLITNTVTIFSNPWESLFGKKVGKTGLLKEIIIQNTNTSAIKQEPSPSDKAEHNLKQILSAQQQVMVIRENMFQIIKAFTDKKSSID